MRKPRAFRLIPRIIVVGRLSPEKGHLILLQAIKLLLDQGIDVELEVVGAGPFEEHIRHEEAQLALKGRITYSGELSATEVSERLAAADIFCMSSFSEGLPVSIMEAMAVGVPVVATWISGIPELALNEVTALTVPAANSEALAEALIRLITDNKLRDTLTTNARIKVEQRHSQERNVDQLVTLFKAELRLLR